MFWLSADEVLTDLANTDVTPKGPEVAEAAKVAAVGADDQPNDVTGGPSILVLNDLWRYVPAYFQTVDAVQPRSEVGRRLLERRRRQIERQQQQQQRRSDVTTSEAFENHRGALPVDQLLAYITNSAVENTAPTSRSYNGRRRKKQSTPSSHTVTNGSSSSNHVLDDKDERRNENVPREVGKKETKSPDDVTASEVADDDAADFVVVRRGRKCRPEATERPTQLQTEVLQLGRDRRHRATFCDSLDEFSLQDDKLITPRADHAGDSKGAASSVKHSVSATAISASTQLSQSLPLSIQAALPSRHCTNPDNPTSSSDSLRPVNLCYSDAVQRNRRNRVDESAHSSISYQHKEPWPSPADNDNCDQTTNSWTITSGNNGQDARVLVTDVHPVLDRDPIHTKHTALGREVGRVSCSTQTSSSEMPQYSTPPPSRNTTAVVDLTGNVSPPPQRRNPVVFLDEKTTKADNNAMLAGCSGLYFGSFDDVSSSSLESEPSDSDREATPSESVGRCLDAATSPITLSPLSASSPPTAEPTPAVTVSHCRRITPLCRTTRSSSSTSGAPVGIVPPIMHTSGDANVFADENSTREEVSRQYCV